MEQGQTVGKARCLSAAKAVLEEYEVCAAADAPSMDRPGCRRAAVAEPAWRQRS
ncbi:MAG: hypothetical protein ACLUSS_03915 [Faecalibacterium sp.]